MLKIAMLFLLFVSTLQAEPVRKSPSYTLDLQGGLYQPSDPNWDSYYGSSSMIDLSVSAAVRFFSVIDIGASASFAQDKGKGRLPLSQLTAGDVIYEILPLDIFAVLRLRFSDRQWIVPYAGGGYTRFFYRQSIDSRTYARGSVNALHAKAGLQILLDVFDPAAAKTMFSNYGVLNTYLLFEGKMMKAQAGEPAIDLGGVSYRVGFLLEY